MARNQRRRVQEALFYPAPSTTTPPDEEKAAERTETTETDVPAAVPAAPSPAEYIARTYGIEPNCTNVPRLLYAILCEVVRGRV
jgi:hypothetical protein